MLHNTSVNYFTMAKYAAVFLLRFCILTCCRTVQTAWAYSVVQGFLSATVLIYSVQIRDKTGITIQEAHKDCAGTPHGAWGFNLMLQHEASWRPAPARAGRPDPPFPCSTPPFPRLHSPPHVTNTFSFQTSRKLLTNKKKTNHSISREQQLWRLISMVLISKETNTQFFSNPSKSLISQFDGNNAFKCKWRSDRVPIFIFKHLHTYTGLMSCAPMTQLVLRLLANHAK